VVPCISLDCILFKFTLGQVFRMNCENQALLAHVGYYPTLTMDVFALLMRQLDVLRGTSRLSEFRSLRLPTLSFWHNLTTINRGTQTETLSTPGSQPYKQPVGIY